MKRLLSFATALTISLHAITAASAAPKKEFNIAWTIYVGWMPWPYAADNGIVKKWADNMASPSTSGRSTTMSNRSTSTPRENLTA